MSCLNTSKQHFFIFVVLLFIFSCASSSNRNYQPYQPNPAPPKSQIDPHKIATNIKIEKSSYSKDYLLDAIDIVGLCDKFLNTPKFQIFPVASEANTALQKLKVNYPQYTELALTSYLSELVAKVNSVSDNVKYIDSEDMKSKRAKNYDLMIYKLNEIGVLNSDIKMMIDGINSGL